MLYLINSPKKNGRKLLERKSCRWNQKEACYRSGKRTQCRRFCGRSQPYDCYDVEISRKQCIKCRKSPDSCIIHACCKRIRNTNFKPKDYWVLKGKFNSEHGSYEGTHVVKKCDKESDADEILRKLSADTGPATVKSIKEKIILERKAVSIQFTGITDGCE